MGLLSLEDEASVTCFLKQFMNVVKHTPKVVLTDTSAAIIASIRTVLPMPFIPVDEWHLNQRQYINVIGTLLTVGRTREYRTMEGDLHLMRRIISIVRFCIHMVEFETSWFGESTKDVKLLSLRTGSRINCGTNASEWHNLEAFMTEDSVVDTNTPNVLEEHENLILRSPGRGRRGEPPFQAECCEDDADVENNSFQSTFLH